MAKKAPAKMAKAPATTGPLLRRVAEAVATVGERATTPRLPLEQRGVSPAFLEAMFGRSNSSKSTARQSTHQPRKKSARTAH
jgi:hypothetical protein